MCPEILQPAREVGRLVVLRRAGKEGAEPGR